MAKDCIWSIRPDSYIARDGKIRMSSPECYKSIAQTTTRMRYAGILLNDKHQLNMYLAFLTVVFYFFGTRSPLGHFLDGHMNSIF